MPSWPCPRRPGARPPAIARRPGAAAPRSPGRYALASPGDHLPSRSGELMPQLRRSYGKVSTNAAGLLYLLCFRERLGTDRHSIKHYLGFTWDLDARLEKHRAGQGARITEVLKERGIGWDVTAVWPGNRGIENQLKLHSATRICP